MIIIILCNSHFLWLSTSWLWVSYNVIIPSGVSMVWQNLLFSNVYMQCTIWILCGFVFGYVFFIIRTTIHTTVEIYNLLLSNLLTHCQRCERMAYRRWQTENTPLKSTRMIWMYRLCLFFSLLLTRTNQTEKLTNVFFDWLFSGLQLRHSQCEDTHS